VTKQQDIETFRGVAPRCRNCNKPLRPNYKSENMPRDHRSGEFRRSYITDPYTLYLKGLATEDGTLTDPPAESEEADSYFGGHTRGGFDAKKQRYYTVEEVRKVKSRKFLGTFGARGDSLFCMTECGYRFAVRFCRGQLPGQTGK
jgi:hypothetical protein